MRDFYDVYILWKLNMNEINKIVLKNAFINTSEYRKTYNQIFPDSQIIISLIEQDLTVNKLWERYQSSYPFARDVSWHDAIHSIKSILDLITG
jgi:hypothetical protein